MPWKAILVVSHTQRSRESSLCASVSFAWAPLCGNESFEGWTAIVFEVHHSSVSSAQAIHWYKPDNVYRLRFAAVCIAGNNQLPGYLPPLDAFPSLGFQCRSFCHHFSLSFWEGIFLLFIFWIVWSVTLLPFSSLLSHSS